MKITEETMVVNNKESYYGKWIRREKKENR